VDRWATFDCYGTLVDWNAGIASVLEELFGAQRDDLVGRYHDIERELQADAPERSYREVLTLGVERLAAELELAIPEGEASRLAQSLPDWPVFEDVRPALEEARTRGWKLAILSNTDRDLVDASMTRIGVPFELAVVAGEIGSYKPAHRHWEVFRAETGADSRGHVHVAQSVYHDIAPAAELGIPSIWINRRGGGADERPEATLPTLTGLADALDGIVPA
jgi:2-haloacid dehalogenase